MNELLQQVFDRPDGWGQFQIYREAPQTISLERAGVLCGIHAPGGRLALACDNAFRFDGVSWTRQSVAGFFFPFIEGGSVQSISCEKTPLGRLVLRGCSPWSELRVVLFQKDDTAGAERWLLPSNIAQLLVYAREEHVEAEVTEMSEATEEFSCGHTGPVSYGYSIFGRIHGPTMHVPKSEHCAECSLARLIEGITRCHACRGPIFNGSAYYVYDDRIFCGSARCSAGPMGSPTYTWRGVATLR